MYLPNSNASKYMKQKEKGTRSNGDFILKINGDFMLLSHNKTSSQSEFQQRHLYEQHYQSTDLVSIL
jgi:hypothetical protein